MDKNKRLKVDDFYCKQCKKQYASYQSYWNHNKKNHTSAVVQCIPSCIPNVVQCIPKVIQEEISYKCMYCNKNYSSRQNKWKHEQKCKNMKNTQLREKEMELLICKEKQKILKQEKQILKLKLKLQKADDVDNVTLKQLNKKFK